MIERIYNSAWYAGSKTVSFEIENKSGNQSHGFDGSKLREAIFPGDEETTAVLAYFRQLHAGDKLFANAVQTYVKHCGDERKNFWVRVELEAFLNKVDSQPELFNVPHTRREIIKMFMYGAGLLHATSNDGADTRLEELVKARGTHAAVAIFNNCLMDIFAAAVPTYHVIWDDYHHWIAEQGLTPADKTDIKTLFARFPHKGD